MRTAFYYHRRTTLIGAISTTMSTTNMPAPLDTEKSVAEDASTGEKEEKKKTQDEKEGSLKDYLVRPPTPKNIISPHD